MDELESLDEVLVKLRAVTLAEVQVVVEKVIRPQQLRLAVIGPFKDDQDRFKKFV